MASAAAPVIVGEIANLVNLGIQSDAIKVRFPATGRHGPQRARARTRTHAR